MTNPNYWVITAANEDGVCYANPVHRDNLHHLIKLHAGERIVIAQAIEHGDSIMVDKDAIAKVLKHCKETEA